MGFAKKVAQAKSLVARVTEWVNSLRVTRVFLHFISRGGNLLAAGMSFKAIFALFAALWVGFAIFGLIIEQRPLLQEGLVLWLNRLVPGLIGPDGATSLDDLLQLQILGWTGAIASVSLVFVAVGWLSTAREAIRRMLGVRWKADNSIFMKVRDFGLAAILAIAIIISGVLSIASSTLLGDILVIFGFDSDSWLLGNVARITALVIMFFFDALVLAGTYRILSGVSVDKAILYRVSLFGAIALAGIKVLGSQLASGVGNNPLLASFTTFIGLLVWFNLICRIILVGAAWIAIESEDRFGAVPGATPASPPGSPPSSDVPGSSDQKNGPGVGTSL